jgi:uncharacterized protein
MDLIKLDSQTMYMGKTEFVGRGQDRAGVHGQQHWARVKRAGLEMAEKNGADKEVVIAFANLHDMARDDDGEDLHHGQRAETIIRQSRSTRPLKSLEDRQVFTLGAAVRFHSVGWTAIPNPWDNDYTPEELVTIYTCWDADRLDLWRVGVIPDRDRLCTAAGREYLAEHMEENKRKYSYLFD